MKKRQLQSPKRVAFLAAYGMCGNIADAARMINCARQSHYRWLADPDYAQAFAEAHEEACDALELEARRRAVEGVPMPLYYHGKVCGTVRKYSDLLLIFLMKAKMPQYRDSWPMQPPEPPRPKVDPSKLSDEQREQLRQIAQAVAGSSADGR